MSKLRTMENGIEYLKLNGDKRKTGLEIKIKAKKNVKPVIKIEIKHI